MKKIIEEPEIKIREWQIEDIEHIRTIALETWRQAYGSFVPEVDLISYHNDEYSLATLESKLTNKIGFVATDNEIAVAYSIAEQPGNENKYSITSLYVLPAYQGIGIGKSLLNRQVANASEKKIDEIRLAVMEQNSDALKWYIKQGFIFLKSESFMMANTEISIFNGTLQVKEYLY